MTIRTVILICFFYGGLAYADKAANPNATIEANAVLRYLNDLKLHRRGVVSGQFESWGRDVKFLEDERNWLRKVYKETKLWPGLVGVEYHNGIVSTENPNKLAIEYWKNGGLVQVVLVMSNPCDSSAVNGGGACQIASVLQDGSANNIKYFEELKQIGDGLEQLQTAGVVVILNIFPESTSNWFWWGGQGSDAFKRLYQATFDYFVRVRGLNNLLFLYEPSSHSKSVIADYPGAPYVDIVGISYFVDSHQEINMQSNPAYTQAKALGKPLSFSQWGPRRGQDQTRGADQSPADNLKLLRGIKTDFRDVVLWMSWNQAYAISSEMNGNKNAVELLSDPIVINRGKINWKKFRQHSN